MFHSLSTKEENNKINTKACWWVYLALESTTQINESTIHRINKRGTYCLQTKYKADDGRSCTNTSAINATAYAICSYWVKKDAKVKKKKNGVGKKCGLTCFRTWSHEYSFLMIQCRNKGSCQQLPPMASSIFLQYNTCAWIMRSQRWITVERDK